jgi:hypothetical protein
MKQTDNKITYSVKDFTQYHAGEMSAEEMHAIERAALEDNFLSDALEGYSQTSNIDKNLTEINEKLNQINKNNSTPTQPLNFKKILSAVAIAASVIVIFTIGYYNFSDKNEHTTIIAKIDNKTSSTNDETNSLQKNNSIEDISKSKPENKNEDINQASNNKNTSKKITTSAIVENTELINPTPTIDIANSPVTAYQQSQDDQKENKLENNDNESKVQSALAKASMDNQIIQSEKATAPQVVAIRKTDKKQFAAAVTYKEPAFKNETTFNPVVGWEAYHEYINSHKKIINDSTGSEEQGIVTLSFILKNDGSPTDIRIEKSLNEGCNNEAIRLITYGPKWNKINNKRIMISITF